MGSRAEFLLKAQDKAGAIRKAREIAGFRNALSSLEKALGVGEPFRLYKLMDGDAEIFPYHSVDCRLGDEKFFGYFGSRGDSPEFLVDI